MNIRLVCAELFHAGRRMDGYSEANSHSPQFRERGKTELQLGYKHLHISIHIMIVAQ